jgi:hypothetical protein
VKGSLMNEELNKIVGETEEETEQEGKFVPVSESIRYRRRAQSAERKAAMLEEEVTRAKSQNEQLCEKVSRIELENKLVTKLISEGVSDLEAAVSVAKSRMEGSDDLDVDEVVEQLRREKNYLFGDAGLHLSPSKTSGVKSRQVGSGQSIIERAAQRAAKSGHRGDLLEYLKLRRSVM